MAITKEHIRFSIHFVFHLKKNAVEATAMICTTYGENAVSHTAYKRWYQEFRQGNFSLEDESHAGHPQRNGRIANTAGYKLCANWKGTCRTAWRYAAKHFRMFTYDGKVQKEDR